MSNAIFCCSLPTNLSPVRDGEPTQVLLRFYGDQYRDCDMSVQLEIFRLLSSKDLGPKLYGAFDNGRLEEYLTADPLTYEELTNKQISSIIAKKLAVVHTLEVPIDKSNTWLRDRYREFIDSINGQPEITTYLQDSDHSDTTKKLALELRSTDFEREREFVQKLLDKSSAPTVFSHNDLHQGNILLAKQSKGRTTLNERIFLIDFEYCSYNYRSYDIANHFCEWCFEYDTPDYPHFRYRPHNFPSEEDQRRFVRNYLERQRKLALGSSDKTEDETCADSSELGSKGDEPLNGHSNQSDELLEEDALLVEVKPLAIAANLLWTLWCIKCASESKIKFGFWVSMANPSR